MPTDSVAEQAVALAAELLEESALRQSPDEKAQAAKIARLMADPNGKTMTMAMSDQVFRSHRPSRIADQLNYLVELYGVPSYLGNWDQWALWLGSTLGEYIPAMVVPFVVSKLRQETRSVILPSEDEEFRAYVEGRRREGTRLNLNQLGEAILGEEEAARRLDAYLRLLARDEVEYISVKISSVFSQINLVAFDHTVEQIKSRLRLLYRQAMSHKFVAVDDRALPKFVNLDMEEYRDLALTVAAFKQVLDEPEFREFRAGIVLQAYLPDAHLWQRDLTEWAMRRGHPIKIRIVKGANLAMERVEAAMHGWPQAPYRTKPEVDANFKRMVAYGMAPDRARAANLGIATHNLFDAAYALLLRERNGVEEFVEMEMLEGMANHQARSVQARAGGLLLYAPVVRREDFHSAIAYLVRRLDENTAPENFLHDLFGLEVGDERWERQRAAFLASVRDCDSTPLGPQRTQNRGGEAREFDPDGPFRNEPDTDWALKHNADWIAAIAGKWRDKECIEIAGGGAGVGHDPSRPDRVAYRYPLASRDEIDRALAAGSDWSSTLVAERRRLLAQCAQSLAARRGDLIGAMMLDGGKSIPEADSEVSEAVDFANYYARTPLGGRDTDGCACSPLGTVLVTPPWNFPLAIPAGGVLASLMAGNRVVLKPAPEAALVSWELCNALWDAGIPRHALVFLPTTDDDTGRALVTDHRVDAVILTGGYATARLFQSWKPDLRLLAETSGKNSMIVTAMADHDQAIKDLVKSAFGHNGQKCSAASLAVLEGEVYDNPSFLRQLRDAAQSLNAGSAWEPWNTVTPLIREPGPDLLRGLTKLDPGETWLLEPRHTGGNLWTPGIRMGVRPGSWYHRTECFGPVLGLMRAGGLDEAIEMVNSGDFGLTSGLESLDAREVAKWRDSIEVGNLYVNRGTTGAIVRRQPFGGWKKSAFGEAKAGGPNYVFSLCRWTQRHAPSLAAEPAPLVHDFVARLMDWASAAGHDEWTGDIRAAAGSYAYWWNQHFSVVHDPSQVMGESNLFRYRRIDGVLIRAQDRSELRPALLALIAARTCGVPAVLSISPAASLHGRLPHGEVAVEGEQAFLWRAGQFERLRVFSGLSREGWVAAHEGHSLVVEGPALLHGRLELRHYLREQSVTQTTHRYGNLLDRR
jgi:RHH-type proline utilization regulon transcriptional repressor/proline dehydrogenase/delta 1-pyrroline-5-carboxylate dehydrogenase